MSNYLTFGLFALACCACGAVGSKPAEASSKPGARVEREVTFKGAGGMDLEGTFLSPGGGKVGAVLLLPGSGPTDRDGNSSLGIRPELLKQIADRLYKDGIASFRFDKRAIAHYQSSWPKDPSKLNAFFSWNHFVEDATAAYMAMRQQPGVDLTRCAVLGHSEGGLITLDMVSQLNATSDAPKAIVLLGTAGRPMGAILHEQISAAVKGQGAPPEIAKQLVDYTDRACAALAKGEPLPPNTPRGLLALFNPTVTDIMGAYCRIDPADLIKKIKEPVLILNGGNDVQISAERDAPRLEEAFKARGSGSQEMIIVAGASHNLKSTAGGGEGFDGPVVPAALDKIATFLKEKLGS